jgi:hypothetical protein
VYWKRDLWENAVDENTSTEDFEKDTADYGELGYPYLTGNGFILQGGNCPSQILTDPTLMDSGNLLHFRDFGCGLGFSFPNNARASAFSFDYRPSEPWILKVNNQLIELLGTRKGFVGIVLHRDYPGEFVLLCRENAQGGLSVDNISYVIVSTP